ncbi:MAG: hypothetical protein FWF84_00490 [Kiritimatiellaeota bacterium]|nr:hypothetical protein [Kiritimatiellota bacterium]
MLHSRAPLPHPPGGLSIPVHRAGEIPAIRAKPQPRRCARRNLPVPEPPASTSISRQKKISFFLNKATHIHPSSLILANSLI